MRPRIVIVVSSAIVLAGALAVFQWQSTTRKKLVEKTGEFSASQTAQVARLPRQAPELARITDSTLHWEERIHAVRAMPEKPEQSSVDSLFSYLSTPPDGDKENHYLVCNEIMEVLRKLNHSPELYSRQLSDLIASPSADPVIRDYAAQHLAQWISGITPEATEPDSAQIPAAVETMLKEASRPENAQLTLPGTIFHALTDAVLNGSQSMEVHRDAVISQAMQVLGDPSFSTVIRSSALQAAARLGTPELREHCLQFAGNSQNPPDLRLSAIAALGQVGEQNDATLLKTLTADPEYRYAATAALQSLSARFIDQ